MSTLGMVLKKKRSLYGAYDGGLILKANIISPTMLQIQMAVGPRRIYNLSISRLYHNSVVLWLELIMISRHF